ncbi:MAG: SprT family zinc-dependent metalloprotease [Candidatus Saccharibacteria bacterium]
MAAGKQFELESVGTVYLYKRKGSKNIRISVNSDGKIRVTLPSWLPYHAGVAFATQKRDWLKSQSRRDQFVDGQRLGKYHTLLLIPKSGILNTKTRLKNTEALVYYSEKTSQLAIQESAHDVAKRATRAEAEKLLPQRLNSLSRQHSLPFNSVSIRHLKTRWGSCSSKHDLTLNYYLMQLPWELIDYVLIHELVHTQHLNHSKNFWHSVEKILPDYKRRRTVLKNYQPSLLLFKSEALTK